MKWNVENLAYWIAAQAGCNPYAEGKPGTGKTRQTQAFNRAMGREMYTLIGSLRDPADIGGYPYAVPARPEDIDDPSGFLTKTRQGKDAVFMHLIPPAYVANCWNGKKWTIFLDELSTCPPAVHAALLRVVCERVVGDLPLPEDTWIMAAGNPVGAGANAIEIEPAMANRLYWHAWLPDHKATIAGYKRGCRWSDADLSFPVVPEKWENLMGPIGACVGTFHERVFGHFDDFPRDRSQQCGPWPSERTWEYAIRGMAAARAAGAPKEIEIQLLCGLVGQAHGTAYAEWENALDLPDPEELLGRAIAAMDAGRDMDYQHPDRGDKSITMLSAVANAVLLNNTKPRWEAAMHVLQMAAAHEPEVAVSVAGPLSRSEPKGGRMPMELVDRLYPLLRRAFA